MRYTKNKISSTFAYFAILANALYFLSIYHSDVGSFYYNIHIGFSVVYNLLFMLFVFLASEGVKNYDFKFSVVLIVIGALQLVRIFGIPLDAFTSTAIVKREEVQVMPTRQFIICCALLVISAGFAIAGGIIGIIKTKKLRNYEKTLISQ
jgi:hypothetical protein